MTVQDFLKSLGGPTQVSRALGIPFTTVASWGHQNSIPHWRMPALADLAKSKGLPVPSEFARKAAA